MPKDDARRRAWLMVGDRRLDNDLKLCRAKINSGLAKCLITISMEIPSCDRGRRSARPSRRRCEMRRRESEERRETSGRVTKKSGA